MGQGERRQGYPFQFTGGHRIFEKTFLDTFDVLPYEVFIFEARKFWVNRCGLDANLPRFSACLVFGPPAEVDEPTESKIPPFTRFARPCGGHKARAERGNGGIFDSVASPTSTSSTHGTFGALRAPKVTEFGQKWPKKCHFSRFWQP